jgi:hypothetical protein
MADARSEHFEIWAGVTAAVGAFFALCRALLHRRKKPPTLSEEALAKIKAEVIESLRKEALSSIVDLGKQMEAAVTMMKAAVMRIEQLVADVPSMQDRISEQAADIRVLTQDVIEIRGELRRARERQR